MKLLAGPPRAEFSQGTVPRPVFQQILPLYNPVKCLLCLSPTRGLCLDQFPGCVSESLLIKGIKNIYILVKSFQEFFFWNSSYPHGTISANLSPVGVHLAWGQSPWNTLAKQFVYICHKKDCCRGSALPWVGESLTLVLTSSDWYLGT